MKLAVLENSEEQRLHAEAHLADLVEEDRAAMGRAQFSHRVTERAGEAPFRIAEQLGFEHGFGYARAFDREERLRRAARSSVDVSGDDVLADATFSGDEDPCRARGEACAEQTNLVHRTALADELREARNTDGLQ